MPRTHQLGFARMLCEAEQEVAVGLCISLRLGLVTCCVGEGENARQQVLWLTPEPAASGLTAGAWWALQAQGPWVARARPGAWSHAVQTGPATSRATTLSGLPPIKSVLRKTPELGRESCTVRVQGQVPG